MALFSVLVDIAAKTASFEQGIKRVEDQLTDFGETVKSALEFTGITLGIKELITQFDEFAEHAEDMSHAAEKTGLAVEELSRLQFAAGQTGVSTEALTQSIERFSKTIVEASNSTSVQAKAFAAIGVSVTDSNGAIKPMEELLKQVSDRFASYSDGAEKTALAQILFGRSGADLIPVLDLGAQGIQKLEQRSDELHNTLSQKTVTAAKDFNEKLGDLKGLTTGLWQTIEAQLLPTLTDLTSSFTKTAGGAETFERIAEATATAVKLVASSAITIGGAFEAIGQFEGGLYAAGDALLHGRFSEGINTLKEATTDLGKNMSSTISSVGHVWDQLGEKIDDVAAKPPKPPAPIISLYNASEQLLDVLNQIDEKVRQTVDSTGSSIAKQGETALTASLAKTHATAVHFWDQLDQLGQTGAKSVQSSFADFLFDPASKGFGGLVTDFGNALKRMLADAAATDLFKALFGSDKEGNSGLGALLSGVLNGFFPGSSGGSVPAESTGPVFGGGKAAGGPLESGKWYIAGENGPEPIWGGGAGAFATGYGGGGSTVNIINNVDARGASVDMIKALPAILKQNNMQLEAKIVTGLQRGKYSV